MIKIVVAADLNNAIGRKGRLPWRLKADMCYFRMLTMGQTVLMGRRTYESIGKALAGRWNVVLTKDIAFDAPDIEVAHSLEEALLYHTPKNRDIFVIGGESLYRELWEEADEIYLTKVHTKVKGADTFVPEIDTTLYRAVSRTAHPKDEDNEYACEFIKYIRK